MEQSPELLASAWDVRVADVKWLFCNKFSRSATPVWLQEFFRIEISVYLRLYAKIFPRPYCQAGRLIVMGDAIERIYGRIAEEIRRAWQTVVLGDEIPERTCPTYLLSLHLLALSGDERRDFLHWLDGYHGNWTVENLRNAIALRRKDSVGHYLNVFKRMAEDDAEIVSALVRTVERGGTLRAWKRAACQATGYDADLMEDVLKGLRKRKKFRKKEAPVWNNGRARMLMFRISFGRWPTIRSKSGDREFWDWEARNRRGETRKKERSGQWNHRQDSSGKEDSKESSGTSEAQSPGSACIAPPATARFPSESLTARASGQC